MKIIAGFAIGIVVAAFGTARASTAPEIWLSALEPQWRAVLHYPPNDWDELFESDAAWSTVARHVQVFEVSKRFVMEAPPAELARVFGFLRAHNIKLALQGTPLFATQACGLGVEGHGAPHDMKEEAERIRHAGGEVTYIAMDEPLFYGRFLRYFPFRGDRKVCDLSIKEMAAQTAAKIVEVREVFPEVQIGDTEPFGIRADHTDEWNDSLRQWIDAFKISTGKPLAFLQADIVWRDPSAMTDFAAGVGIALQAGIPLGVIYNAAPSAKDWIVEATQNLQKVEKEMNIHPRQAVFQSWTDQPRIILPETDPNSLTGLVREYIRTHD